MPEPKTRSGRVIATLNLRRRHTAPEPAPAEAASDDTAPEAVPHG